MHSFAKSLVCGLCAGLCQAAPQPAGTATNALKNIPLPQLEKRLAEIDHQLTQLARFTTRGGTGSIGWTSKQSKTANHPEWATLHLAANELIDRIVLVPILWNYAEKGPSASGFPEAFEIIAGTANNKKGSIIARFTPKDQLLPRMAPLVIDIAPTPMAWIRFKSLQMSTSGMDKRYTFGFSEIMLFSGNRNVAQNQRVTVSSSIGGWGGEAISAQALTDGSIPFLMNSSQGKKTRTYLARFNRSIHFWLIIDLEKCYPVDEIRFHSALDVRQHIPLPKQVEYGLPRHLTVEGANKPDFSDAISLLDYHLNSIYDAGPILVRTVPETRCRYIRLSVPNPYPVPNTDNKTCLVNFSELEIISHGQNVALNKNVILPHKNIRSIYEASITDGSNNYGTILPIRDWMEQLALRHTLEKERPLLWAELNMRYARQKRNLWMMYWTAGTLAIIAVFIILIDRLLRMHHVARLKQRFAADLHDELGANLHSIGMISDVARQASSQEQWETLCSRIRDLTERTGSAVRCCTNLLEAEGLYIGLTTDMQRAAKRITTNLEHHFSIEGQTFLDALPPRKRVDLFLFYKECLVNICRHSGATAIKTQLVGTKKAIVLTVCDNGRGLPNSMNMNIVPSLQRRARLLGASVSVQGPESGGIIITLRLRNRKHWRMQSPRHASKITSKKDNTLNI